MNNSSFPIPIDPKKDLQKSTILIQLIEDIKIILKRIKNEKFELAESKKISQFFPYLLTTLVLDIKSLYVFSKIFIDKLILYITETFFSELIGKGLANESFNRQITSLRNKKISEDNCAFLEYKDYILRNERRIFFKIINIRDKLIIHGKLKASESYGYDDQVDSFDIYLMKVKDPFKIDKELKNKIIEIGQKYNIKKVHDRDKYSEFVYLDSILGDVERILVEIDNSEKRLIKSCRERLGMIINEEKLFQIIYDFSDGIAKLLKEHFPNISYNFEWRFPL